MTRRLLVIAALLVALTGLLAVGTTAAAQPATTEEPATATEGVAELDDQIQILAVEETEDEVILEVAVSPAIGPLFPLDSSFSVLDGGGLVDLVVTPVENTTDTVLVLDTSGSMRGSALTAAKAAAGSFVEALPDDARVGLIGFGEKVDTYRTPTLDRAAILADLDGLVATGDETVLWDALRDAADMAGGSPAGQSSVVVLSDGDDTASSSTPSDVVDQFGAGSTRLYAVAIESSDTDLVALEETVELVGGQFLPTTDIGLLDSLYTDIAGRLANRYLLRFQPAQQGARTIVVSVVANGSVATARTSIGSGPGPAPAGPSSVLNIDDRPVLGAVTTPSPGALTGATMLWLGLGSTFAALAIIGLIVARPAAQVRLDAAVGADRLGGINARMSQATDRLISRHDRGSRIDSRLEAANINLRPGEFVSAWLLATAGAAVAVWALFGLAPGLLMVPFSIAAAFAFLGFRASRWQGRFADQLTETLGIMASSLRAGQSLPRAIELVASEAPSPTAEQFHRISFETRVGRDLTESIRDAADRMDSPDLEWLAQAVDINRELGGDLTEILDNVAATIRERRTVARQIDALSAEGRATGWVLLVMPIVLFLFSWWRTPDSIGTLFTEPLGRLLLIIAVAGMAVGHVWIRHLVRLKY